MGLGWLAEYLTPTTVYSTTALTLLTWIAYKKSTAPRYPPGPSKLPPWIGSLAYMPKHRAWETYTKWGKEYNSDILHMQGAGLNIIILNSMEAAVDLLDKRSAIYSSRSAFSIVEITGWEWLMSNMLYTTAWRERRKLFQKHFHPSKPEVFQHKYLTSVRERLIPNLFENPKDWANIFRYAIGSTTLSLAYGLPFNQQESSRLPSRNNITSSGVDSDPRGLNAIIKLAEAAVGTINASYAEGAVIVDLIPALKYFPSWFPGLAFKAKMPEWRRLATEFRELPFDVGRSLIAEGKAEESFISLCLDDGEKELEVVKDTAGMMFAGGVDTTLALLHNFILAMLLHPEAQKRAQEELDQLLAAEKRHVPEWNDKDKLPYLAAVLKEVLRWRPVLPLGAPHAVTQDDEYKGYHIPKDSLIIPNSWLMLHNEETYGINPDKFQPERFLDEKGQLNRNMRDPADVAFGFGRRVCPGTHVALYNLFMVATHVLSVFNIEYAVDETTGQVKTPSMDWPDLVVCPPLPFDCKFVPRGELGK
ncbi:hypothetical protein D9756_009494 [Leucocoprinus leucothites]|uniref:Cytochrome P450 n=1 Tax=Leucocoprinus leucothites TaxID=201217 RepID=A0A8H5CXD1_9AGAR|nr:hypothetical protein D9756_009494 [Leucoagaricus leucothites]